jgi:hypothetical protein
MNLSERRAAVRAALIADPQRSARSIHDEVGVRWDMIARIRAELVADKLASADGPIRRRNGSTYRARGKLYRGTTRRAVDFNATDLPAPGSTGSRPRTTPCIWRRARPETLGRL